MQGGEPFVEVVFTNKLSDRVMTGDLTAPQIVEKIQERSQTMDSDEILKKVRIQQLRWCMTWAPRARGGPQKLSEVYDGQLPAHRI